MSDNALLLHRIETMEKTVQAMDGRLRLTEDAILGHTKWCERDAQERKESRERVEAALRSMASKLDALMSARQRQAGFWQGVKSLFSWARAAWLAVAAALGYLVSHFPFPR